MQVISGRPGGLLHFGDAVNVFLEEQTFMEVNVLYIVCTVLAFLM